MYLAKRTRPEILIALSLLGSRVRNPDNFDLMCLQKVYKYLAGTLEYGLRFRPHTMTLHYWIDAAYGVHADDNLKSHTGIATTIGFNNAPVFVKSCKQKLTTRSSTEAELVALDSGLMHLLWFAQVLGFFRISTTARLHLSRQSVGDLCMRDWPFQVWQTQAYGYAVLFYPQSHYSRLDPH